MRISDWSSDVCSSDLIGADLDRLDVRDQLVDLLCGERTAALLAPRRHRGARAAVDEDVAHLLFGVAQQHGVEGGRLPGDGGDELALVVGEGERGDAADPPGGRATGAVVAAVGRWR